MIGPKETFEFDLNGFVIIRDFLSKEMVARLNDAIDAQPYAKQSHKFHFMKAGDVFLDLMSDRRVLELCKEWIDPHFRFDHAWGVQHYPNDPNSPRVENLHGGPFAEQGAFQYHWHRGKPRTTCILFAYVLEPQRPGDGGLALMPGSHKSNTEIGIDVFNQYMGRDYHASPWIHRPDLNAGDLLIFTEATMHGTEAWKPTDRRRRNIYYKYCYGWMGWPPVDHEESVWLRANARNEQEKLLVRPPFVSETTGNELRWRGETLLAEPASALQRGKNLIARGIRKLG